MTRAAALIAALLFGVAGDVAGRGGARGGGGFAHGGVAARGSFGQRSAGSGRYSGQGPAASGTFAGRSTTGYGEGYGAHANAGASRPPVRDWGARREQRQDGRNDARENWQNYDDNRRENWQDYAEDHHDDRYYGAGDDYPYGAAFVAGAAVGAAVATPPYWTLDCVPTTVVIGGTTYYQCGSAWYVRVYSGGDVAYTMVNPPAGY